MPISSTPPARIPDAVHAARDYEALARDHLPAPTYAYLAGGSDRDLTLRANRAAFSALAPLPRLLREVRGGHTRTTLLGRERPHPMLFAPVAFQRLAHPLGEIETARAAAAADTPLIVATLASQRLEDIAAEIHRDAGGEAWFQLYLQPRRADSLALLRRAEDAGCRAVVLTLDAAIQVPSRRALAAGFTMPADVVAANLAGLAPPPEPPVARGASRVFQGLMAHAPTWDDLDWLLAATRLPILVKGVQHPDDARALRDRGVAGIVVSNHGGRGLDGAPASLTALPTIRAALGPEFPVLFDGGVRSGGDVFRAIALGADAVLLGRLPIYALAVAGALGVAHLVRLLREELELTMAMTGCADLAAVRAATLIPTPDAPRGAEDDRPC